jgi:hypothetical protein
MIWACKPNEIPFLCPRMTGGVLFRVREERRAVGLHSESTGSIVLGVGASSSSGEKN